jgi:hypothetical protein
MNERQGRDAVLNGHVTSVRIFSTNKHFHDPQPLLQQ